jgi:hypothetical protein
MYSLDPWTDPHGAVFQIEWVWYKAQMGEWLVNVSDSFQKKRLEETLPKQKERLQSRFVGRLDPSVLPGWMFGKALALRVLKVCCSAFTVTLP